MTVTEGTRLKVLDERASKAEETMMKHGELLEQLTAKIGEIATTHVTLAREHSGVAHALNQISERLNTIELNQRAAREGDLGNGLLPAPVVGRRGDIHGDDGHQPDGRGNRQPGWQFPIPKLEFPLFDGTDPKQWVRRCEKFLMFSTSMLIKKLRSQQLT